jgi:hypothetical protein
MVWFQDRPVGKQVGDGGPLLSFTTLSSTGLSDITPISGHARSVVMIEQTAGVLSIAMVVTRLVALRGQRTGGRADDGMRRR